MKRVWLHLRAAHLLFVILLLGASRPVRAAQFASATAAVEGSYFFSQRVVWVGNQPPAELESQQLLQILDTWRANGRQSGMPDMEMFLAAYTNSAWAPSLHANLGKFYRDRGLISLALEHWGEAWTLTRNYQDGYGKQVADYTLAHWTRLLASLGRFETLAALFKETNGRVLDRGPLSQMWVRTREAFGDMALHPEHSYKCGTFALDQVAQTLGLQYDARALVSVPSPTNGFSMKALTDLCARLGLSLLPVTRGTDDKLVVPSVVHWNQDHYAAIIAQIGPYYKVVDPTFGYAVYLTADVINAEASGNFFVSAYQIPTGWRTLSSQESSLIYGRGNYNMQADNNDGACQSCPCPPGAGGGGDTGGTGGSPSAGQNNKFWGGTISGGAGAGNRHNTVTVREFGSCKSCSQTGGRLPGSSPLQAETPSGMPVWRVSEPYINLWLEDEPIGYQPALGPRVSLLMSIKQHDEFPTADETIFNFGNGWNSSWFSYVSDENDTPTLSVDVQMPLGSYLHFDFVNGWATNYYNNYRLQVMTNGSGTVTNYTLYQPDGSKTVYDFFRTFTGVGWGEVFMSQQVDAFGNAIQFQYPGYDPDTGTVLLKYVVDGDGRTNTVSYLADDTYYWNRVGTVTDPFGRTVSFGRAAYTDGLGNVLTNLTDVASFTSSFIYDGNGWVTNLTTPYGTTTFAFSDPGVGATLDRDVIVTEADGGGQAFMYRSYCNYDTTAEYQAPYPTNQVPANTPIGTFDNQPGYRDSFYWGREQFLLLPSGYRTEFDTSNMTTNDYLRARMRHWLGGADEGAMKPIDTLSLERDPSPDGTTPGQTTWYDYPNKGAHGNDDKGTQIMPGVVARVLPDGSTWYTYFTRNGWGTASGAVETYTKTDGSIGTRTNSFGFASDGIDLLTVTNASGVQVSSNRFNAYHQVLTNFNALNEMSIYTYDASHRLATAQTPAGLLTTQTYGGDGRLSTSVDSFVGGAALRTNSYTWNSDGTLLSHTDPRNLAVTNYWDNLQRLTGTLYPDNTTASNIYTLLDRTATKDRLGNWTYSGYDAIRRKIAETNANSVITRYGYCECGSLMHITNAFGTAVQEVMSFDYDYQGNRTYVIYPDGTTITNWFDSMRRPIATADGIGTRWFGYNNQSLLTSVTNGAGVERATVFDIEDRVYSSTDANGVTVTNTYDDLGRLRTRTYPDSGVEAFGFTADVTGMTSYTNQLSKVWTYSYDAASRKTNEIGVGVYTNSFTYSAASDLLTLKDGKSQVTTWNYDLYGRVTNKLDQASVEILRYSYDAGSRLTNRWSKAMGNTAYLYDNAGNLTKVDYPSGTTDINLSYDANNRLTNMVDAAGTTAFTYYAGGLLATEDGPWSNDTVTNVYSNRLRTGLTLQQTTGTWTNGFTWDAARRLSTVTSSAGTFTYTYQTPGTLVKKLALPNTSYITNTFDTVARLTGTYLDNSSNTILDKDEYLYNAGNQRIRDTRADSSYYTNNYDNIGQLVWADSTVASEDRGYVYDAAFNLNKRTNNATPTTFSVDSKNQLTTVGSDSYGYDSNGNLTNPTFLGYHYDAENQLVNITYTNTSKGDFVFDGMQRLRKHTESTWDVSHGWMVTSETRYVYDGRRVIQERNSGNTPTVSYTRGADLSGSLEGAGGIGGLLSRSHAYQSGSGSFTNHNYYHADGNGNITYMVDTNQSMVASYRYDPFGRSISSSGTLSGANMYRFSSKEWTGNWSLYYFGYRFYDPNLQRWLNRDPIEEAGFDVATRSIGDFDRTEEKNLYTFVFNNPNGFIDSDGLSGTIALPIPIEFPPIPIPGWFPPVVAGGIGFGIGWGAGTWLDNHTAVGRISDWVCPKEKHKPRDECKKEWEEAYRDCAALLSRPHPPRDVTGGYTNIRDCARGLVSEECGGNAVDYGPKGKRK